MSEIYAQLGLKNMNLLFIIFEKARLKLKYIIHMRHFRDLKSMHQ